MLMFPAKLFCFCILLCDYSSHVLSMLTSLHTLLFFGLFILYFSQWLVPNLISWKSFFLHGLLNQGKNSGE